MLRSQPQMLGAGGPFLLSLETYMDRRPAISFVSILKWSG